MEQPVWENSKGMSLIEVMIAIVLLMIVSMALMQTSLIGFQTNVQNTLREEAVRVADQTMNQLRDKSFATMALAATALAETPLAGTSATLDRTFRGFAVTYTVNTKIKDININALISKQITVEVSWPYRGKTYSHSITSIVGQT